MQDFLWLSKMLVDISKMLKHLLHVSHCKFWDLPHSELCFARFPVGEFELTLTNILLFTFYKQLIDPSFS